MGRTIKIFLVDEDPTGLLSAEIMNWTGKIISVPRNQISKLQDREEAKRTGVYFLIGQDPGDASNEVVYVGEGDNVLKRIVDHDANRDDWDRLILVISKDENITKAHGRYLESRLIEIASTAKSEAFK